MCAVVGTGLLLELRMDDEHGASQLLGMSTDDWGETHFAIAITFVILAAVHGILHRSWIKMMFQQNKLSTMIVFSAGIVLITSLLVWPKDDRSESSNTPHIINTECNDQQ
jgi:hypothetical protein